MASFENVLEKHCTGDEEIWLRQVLRLSQKMLAEVIKIFCYDK